MADSPIKHASEENFDEIVIQRSNEVLVLVDFWAEWCGPCKAVAPILEELAAKYVDGLDVIKADVDSNGSHAATYKVSGIPTMVLFKDGAEVGREIGAKQLADYEEFIKSHISKGE